ncbi:MAG TPA: hypothetical protein VGL05_19555 [Kribbella sp.]
MSRRKEAERLKEDLAAVIAAASSGSRRPLTKREAEKIRLADEARRKELRENGMRARLAAQHLPWRLAAGVALAAGIEWLILWLFDPFTAIMLAFFIGALIGWAGWMAGRRTMKWRRQIHIASLSAAAWLGWTAATGPSWAAAFWWVLGTVACSLRWWKANRIPHPLAPNRDRVPVPVLNESVPALWDRNVAAKDRCLPGSSLSGEDTTKPNVTRYFIELVPGKQTPQQVLGSLSLIAGGLRTPVKQVVLEPDPDHDPNRVLMSLVEVSPIDQTMPYKGARIVGDHDHMLEVGPYGDGDGWARWRMWQPGEKPMTGSWLSGSVIAGTGIGKSRLMELLAAGYMASGRAVVWFVDPQGGASSPALQEYADWYVSSEGVGRMITALEAIAKAREAQNSLKKWSRFDPSPERPGIVVFLDECHVTIEKYAKRLEDLARKTQKVGISFIGLTQGASLESLGKDILRACLTANLIVMKTGSGQTKNLLPGLPVDPETLPKIAGFGYSIGTDGSRTAPFRSEYVAEPEVWFKRYPMPKLDALSANAVGDAYQLRRETAAEEQEANRQWVEALESGESLPEPDLDDWGDDEPSVAQGGAFQPPSFPVSPFARPQDKPADQRILVAVAQGVTRTKEIERAIGLGKSQTAALLRRLVDEQHLEQPTKGVYAIAGSASPPER